MNVQLTAGCSSVPLGHELHSCTSVYQNWSGATCCTVFLDPIAINNDFHSVYERAPRKGTW